MVWISIHSNFNMFGTFLLFILYIVAMLGAIVGFGIAIFFLLRAKQELTQPKEIAEMLKDPMMFLSEHDFSEEGNEYRLRFLQFLGISFGLLILILLLRLVLA